MDRIDCDRKPFVPRSWQIRQHTKGGLLDWDPTRIKLFYAPIQQDGRKFVEFPKLLPELAGVNLLNACVLDYLVTHQSLIPEEWYIPRGGIVQSIYFPGTLYQDAARDACIRCLEWNEIHWTWGWTGKFGSDSYDCLMGGPMAILDAAA